jgi:hypothetical protein
MADGITFQSATPATPPAASVVATDDAGAAGHVQIIKLAISTDGSATVIPADATNGLDVDVTRLPALPAGTNNIGDVDVLTLPALPAGTNNIGDVDILSIAAGDNNIGNVDVVTLPALPTGTNTIGNVKITDGTDTALVDVLGNLMVNIGEQSIALESPSNKVDDAAYSFGVDWVDVAGFVFDDVAPDSVNEGDTGAARMSANRNQYVQIRDNSGQERGLNIDANGELGISAIRSALPAGTNAIGKLAANSGIDIGDVDVTSIVPGSGATNLGKAEDAVHASGDIGIMVLGVRNDAGSAFAADGDYAPFSLDASGALRVTGGGGGTQYTEDAVAAADPVGTALNLIRKDTLAGLTSADGDNVAARGTDKGELYVKHVDAIPVTDNAGSLTVDGTVTANLAAGTNNIGDVDILTIAAGDNNIGNVDIVTMPNVTLAAGTNTNEVVGDVAQDVAVAGNPLLIGGRASAAAPTDMSADGDAVYLWTTLKGALNIADAGGSLTVDNGGTFAVQSTIAAGATNIAKAEDVASADADVGVPAMAVRKATPANTSGTDGDYEMLQMSAGRLWVDASGVTLTVASHAVTNAGTFAVQVDGNALTALQLIDDTIFSDDAAFTPGTSKVSVVGFQADETSTDSVDEGDAGAPRMTLDRKVITTPQPHAKGGLLIFRSLDLDETEEDIKTSAGQVYGWFITNRATSPRYIKFYNATAANTTVGTTTPVLTFEIPGNSTDHIAANALGTMGIEFDTAICAAATTGFADADTGAPGTNDVIINVFYK